MRKWSVVVLVAVVAALAGGCGPSSTVPEPDECDAPSDAVATSLEIGGREGSFTPLAEDSVVTPVEGSQGGTMLPVRLRFAGDGLPGCVSQRTTITDVVGNLYTESAIPLRTYSAGDAMRATRPDYLIFYDRSPEPGDVVVVTAEALGASDTRSVFWLRPYEGPELTGLTTPDTVTVGDTFSLEVSLDAPITEPQLPVSVHASDPSLVDVPPRFYVVPTGLDILLPVRALGPGTVELRAASGRVVQSVIVTISP